ncbi:synaptogyrin-4 isoform X1 [Mustela erminea]|uniref:synaptogyrin-4 isoform X1 n=1 Tax=Mustela erminea TaxID=36723 RepID=UPI001386AB96|nr:synaptogyrin-4 isoform X1 [Mustela erminea]XP_032181280.1 synaptogyrin-4 isoform X1 [Mustela erminea]
MHIPESLQDLADSEAVQFLKRPKTITRIIAGVFSLIVFSSLLTDGYQNKTESSTLHCILNSNNVACSFAVGAGLLAFLSCLTFLALDAHESRGGSARFKTAFQLLDFILAGPGAPSSWSDLNCPHLLFPICRIPASQAGKALKVLWTGIWFVGFCFLANQWQHSSPKGFLLGRSSAKAAITFAFFSILIWIFQAYLALQDLRNDTAVPYKRSLDEGGVVLTTLSPPSAASPVNTPTAGPNNLSYASSALSPYLTTPKAPRLAMMTDN